jgi:integrase/recombinase XerC
MAENELMKATQNWVDLWLNDLKIHGAFEKTIETYRRGLTRFMRWLYEQGITEPTAQDIARYRDDLKQQYSAQTVNLSLSAVRSFYRYLLENGAIGYSPAAEIRGIRGGKHYHKRANLSDAEVRDVLDTCDQSPQGIRDRAILTLMAYCGLRTIEVSRANVDDLKANGRLLLWVQGKGHSEPDDFVVIPVEQERVIRAWLAERAKLTAQDNALFLSLSRQNKGKRLSTRSIRNLVMAHFEQAGIHDPQKTTHSLRHSAISNVITHGGSPLQAQAFARHKTFDTTLGYIHEVNRLAAPAEDLISY